MRKSLPSPQEEFPVIVEGTVEMPWVPLGTIPLDEQFYFGIPGYTQEVIEQSRQRAREEMLPKTPFLLGEEEEENFS